MEIEGRIEDNIKIDLTIKIMDGIQMDMNLRVQWWVVVNMVTNLGVP